MASEVTCRSHEGDADFRAMLELMARVRPAAFALDYPAEVDIEEHLAAEEIRAATRLWFEEGRLVARAYVDDGNNLLWEADPSRVSALGADIVAWGEARVRTPLEEGGRATLDAGCREDNRERLAFPEAHGFRPSGGCSVRMIRDLSEPIPTPAPPEGFAIRPAKGVEEAAAIAAAHRAAFGTDYMSTENRLVIMNSSEYDPDLDLLAVAPDGTIVGYCTCSAETEESGFTDPVALRPDHQRRGLGKALLLEGLGLLKGQGMARARFSTSGDNLAMRALGESVGFRLERRSLWYEKEVSRPRSS